MTAEGNVPGSRVASQTTEPTSQLPPGSQAASALADSTAHDPQTLQRVMDALDRAAAKLEATERAATEPIAVVGLGCRFPGGSHSPQHFWQQLADGFDGIGDVPADRWDVEQLYDPNPEAAGKMYVNRGGFLANVDEFDARFFEIAPREAADMDPQQRLLLEVCWEALEQAGIPADRLSRSRTGVYVGVTTNEYGNLLARAGYENIDAWFGAGNALNSTAGRVAHTLGLQGPAMAIDTACSSSLVALHLACQSLRGGECDMALSGGVNLILSPEVMIAVCRARMLSTDGRCKTFDAAADGYVRGEGCGVVVLKRLSDAQQQGDNILAILRGSAVNQDGPSSGFTVPNGQAQQALIRQALSASKVGPHEIDYLEAHGTGTSLGDPIEVQAAAAVLGENRPSNRPLLMGSVKTNVGHLESAAGIAGLIKVVLSLQQAEVPPHLHFRNPNPHIPWERLPVQVTARATAWPKTDHPRRAALSSFGASGTNAHVIVEQAPEAQHADCAPRERPVHLLTLSTKTPQALRDLAERYVAMLADTTSSFADICFSANSGRSHLTHRLAIVAANKQQAREELQQFLLGEPLSIAAHGIADSERAGSEEQVRSREHEPWEPRLRRLAELYVTGAAIDWQDLDEGDSRRRVPLPTYPWQRKRYWYQQAEPTQQASSDEALGQTATLRALHQGDFPELANRLASGRQFSNEEQALLPKLLQAIADQLRDEQAEAATDQWLYRLAWRSQIRGGRQSPPTFLPQPAKLCPTLQTEVERLTSSDDFQQYWQAVNAIEQLSIAYASAALSRMGLERQTVRLASTEDLCARLQVGQRHQRLLARLSEMLVESEPLAGEPRQAFRALLDRHPAARAELTLLDRCGSQLDEVMRGRCDPLQLLFPEDDEYTASQLYENSPSAKVMNAVIGRAVADAVVGLPADRKLRVLEIGAGTGGTTSSLLPQLPTDRTEYMFTDVSPRFTTAAQTKFQEFPFVEYQVLDIERSPDQQGFEPGRFDLVVAANVLHATRDLGESVAHARRLLAPGGLLVLLEGTQPLRFIDLIFGLTEGWWRFEDRELRPSHPLIAASAWERLLLDRGFDKAQALKSDDGILSTQTVVVARASAEAATDDQTPREHWIILADQGGVGQHLAALTRSQGNTSSEIFAGERCEQTAPGVGSMVPERLDDLQRIIADAPTNRPVRVVHLWSLDATDTDLRRSATLGCHSVLNLAQCLTAAPWAQPPQLCLVTRQATAVDDADKVEGLCQSPLWGMARVIAAEHPELAPRRIDLGSCDVELAARMVFDELQSGELEDETAFRSGRRFVPRLVRADAESTLCNRESRGYHSPRGDASYLITGGLGGLGLLIARSMVQSGARHVVLTGRRVPTEAAAEQIREIEKLGATVGVHQADVSIRDEMVRVLARIDESCPPLRGVIHAAGVLEDGVLRQLSWDRFARVLAPKVDGAWHLHQLTAGMPLDFFFLFSSATSLLGSPGQSNHAAANAYLDALAHFRRAQGLPALSINWGAWSEVGAAARHDVSQRVKLKGIGVIPPQQGLAVLDRLSATHLAQVAVVPVDWQQQTSLPPRFSELMTSSETQSPEQQPGEGFLRERVLAAAPHRRRAVLVDHVRQSVAGVLGLSADEINGGDGFMELGMDSLTSIELRTRLQHQLQATLPSTVAFDYPTAGRLADFLLDQLNGDGPHPSAVRAEPDVAPAVGPVGAPFSGGLDDLSEDELAALIDDELRAAAE